jgi:hypothetical protein
VLIFKHAAIGVHHNMAWPCADDAQVYLRYHKLQISGNKQALVERIIDKETGGAL